MKKVAVYIRVSSLEQVQGESLDIQRRVCQEFVEEKGWSLGEVYEDAGISGKNTKDRPALTQLLQDASKGRFQAVVCKDLDRFGRKARDILNNLEVLKEHKIEFHSVKDGIEVTGTEKGNLLVTIKAAIAEYERAQIRERTLSARVSLARKGVPSISKMPYGRLYDKETHSWSLDEFKAECIRWAATEYLKGKSARDIVKELGDKGLKIGYSTLLRIFGTRCGTEWAIDFGELGASSFTIPPLLDQPTIKALQNRLASNRCYNRTVKGRREYLLTGFLKCEMCGKSYSGATQVQHGTAYSYYAHHDCEPTKKSWRIPMGDIDRAVIQTLWENFSDETGFNKAIEEDLPSPEVIDKLDLKIVKAAKDLGGVNDKLDKLVQALLNGTLEQGTIKTTQDRLLSQRAVIEDALSDLRQKRNDMPELGEAKREIERFRRSQADYYGSPERLAEMSFAERKSYLHWIFEGQDENGRPYGVYLTPITKEGKHWVWDYEVRAQFLIGGRYLKGDDYDYEPDENDVSEYSPVEGIERDKTYKLSFTVRSTLAG